MKQTAFDKYHPIIAALYLLAVLVFTMGAFHPVFLGLSFVVGVIFNMVLKGPKAVLRSFAWQLPLIILIAVVNPIFSASGSTVLFIWGGYHAYFLESMLYGLCMGVMLISVMIWFSNLSHILTSDKLMQLTGNIVPTIGLMITMILRLVPQFVRRGGSIKSVQMACTSARVALEGTAAEHRGFFMRKVDGMRSSLRNISVLMGWGMEDSLDTSEAMRARGWGVAKKRTTYKRNDFRAADAVVTIILGVLIVASTVFAIQACSGFDFYPSITSFRLLWWGYLPYVVLLIFPFILMIKERLAWRS